MEAIIWTSDEEESASDDDHDHDELAAVERMPVARTCRIPPLNLLDGAGGTSPSQGPILRHRVSFVGLPSDNDPNPLPSSRPARSNEHVDGDVHLKAHCGQQPTLAPVAQPHSRFGSSSHDGGQEEAAPHQPHQSRLCHVTTGVSDYSALFALLQQPSYSGSRTAGELPSSPLKPTVVSYARNAHSYTGIGAPAPLLRRSISSYTSSSQAQAPASDGRTSALSSPMASRTTSRNGRLVEPSSNLLESTTRSLLSFATPPRSSLQKTLSGGSSLRNLSHCGQGELETRVMLQQTNNRGAGGDTPLGRRVRSVTGEKGHDDVTHLFAVLSRPTSSGLAVKRSPLT